MIVCEVCNSFLNREKMKDTAELRKIVTFSNAVFSFYKISLRFKIPCVNSHKRFVSDDETGF